MKNKKGFTLIELLAVIVILAIIALIAAPIVLNIIENSRESSEKRSAELYVDTLEKNIIAKQMKLSANKLSDGTYNIDKNGDVCLDNSCSEVIKVSVKGTKPTDGTITIQNGKITWYDLVINNKNAPKKEYTDESCFEFNKSTGTITDYLCTGLVEGKEDINDVIIPSTIDGVEVKIIALPYGYTMDSLVMPDTVTTIKEQSFSGSGLSSVKLSNNLKTIEVAAFMGNQLTNIIIPSSVETIGFRAFVDNQLINVKILGKTSPSDFKEYYTFWSSDVIDSPFGWGDTKCEVFDGSVARDDINPCISWEG